MPTSKPFTSTCDWIVFLPVKTPRSPKCQETHSKVWVQWLKNDRMTHCYADFKLVAEGILSVSFVGISFRKHAKGLPFSVFIYVYDLGSIYVCMLTYECGYTRATHTCGSQRTTYSVALLLPPGLGHGLLFTAVWDLVQKLPCLYLSSHHRYAGVTGPSYYPQRLHGF